MFCAKCGRKVSAGTARCPKCGGDVLPADYCGGFWNLTASGGIAPETRAAAPDPNAAQRQDQLASAVRRLEASKKRERSLLITVIALSVALLLAAAALIFSLVTRPEAPEPDDAEEQTEVVSPEPSAGGTEQPSPVPTGGGSAEPTAEPSPEVSVEPTNGAGGFYPTPLPSLSPTPTPGARPIPLPTDGVRG